MRYCYYSIILLGDPETPFLVPGTKPPKPTADAQETTQETTVLQEPSDSKACAPAAVVGAENETAATPNVEMPNIFEDDAIFDMGMDLDFGEMDLDFE